MPQGAIAFTTPRQILRRFTADDGLLLFELNSDPEVLRYVPDGPFASLEAAEAHCRNYVHIYENDGFARWACFDRGSGEFLGWCGLRRQDDGEVDLGYRYRRDAWGRGLATEAAEATLEYGFAVLDLPRITAHAYEENAASRRILEKLGFTFTHAALHEGANLAFYAIEKSDYPGIKAQPRA